MSKNFKSQDHFRYKKLGKRWRRPVGLQSKLRIRKGGSGRKVAIGYGTPNIMKNKIDGLDVIYVSTVRDLTKVGNNIAIIASGVGGKKTAEIEKKAKELEVRILNMKKVRRARKISKIIEKNHIDKKKRELEKKKEDEKKKEEKKKEKTEHTETKEHTHDHKHEGHAHEEHGPEHKHAEKK